MNWEAIGAVGEVLGAVGVIVTLGYLAVQIRQTNVNTRAQARQTLIDTWSVASWELARDPELIRVFAEAMGHWPDVSDQDKTAFNLAITRFVSNIQNGLLLRDAGLLDDAVLDQVAYYMLTVVRSPAGSRWWNDYALAWPEVRAYLDQRLAGDDIDIPTFDELMPNWTALASKRPERSS
jgi:hypothetical protein